jgi:hypothetical protein
MIQILAGLWLHLPPPYGKLRLHDPRVKAALLLSPRGRDWMVPSRRCWRDMRLPMMSMTGSHDLRPRRGRSASWQLEPIRFSPPGGKYGVHIDGANHLSFTLKMSDQTEVVAPAFRAPDADPSMIFNSIQVASLAFWDAHLKEDALALAWLRANPLHRASGGKVHIQCR